MSEENTETLTLTKSGGEWEIVIIHDQTGSGYNCKLSDSAYSQLRDHFEKASFGGPTAHYESLQVCCGKILDKVDEGKVPQREIAGLRILLNRGL